MLEQTSPCLVKRFLEGGLPRLIRSAAVRACLTRGGTD